MSTGDAGVEAIDATVIEREAPMASKNAPDTVAAAPVIDMTLDEFCTRLSHTDRRVAMIAGFHFTEKLERHLKDTEENFRAKYAAFLVQPV